MSALDEVMRDKQQGFAMAANIIGKLLKAWEENEAELDALRLSLAQAQAREAGLREALTKFKWAAAPEQHQGTSAYPYEEIVALLATPADDGALREVLTQVARAAMSCGGSRANAKLDFVADVDVEQIVARVLGGAS